MGFATVHYEKRDRVAIVRLNRPQALNAINVAIRDDLFQLIPALIDDPDVRLVILGGEGRAFCAGADVTEFGTAPSPVEARRIRQLRPIWSMLATFPKPIIAALHGYAIGAGIELALLCDLRVASEETIFSTPEVTLGLIPGAGGSQTIPRAARIGHAMDLVLTGRRFSAAEALRMGIVNRVVPRDHLDDAVERLANRILARAPLAVQAAKRAVRAGLDLPLAEGLRLEKRLSAQLVGTDDRAEGVRAFLERRAPRFAGR